MNISRNGPCPCGSGKKYKRCCASSKSYSLKSAKFACENQQNDEVDTEVDEKVDNGDIMSGFGKMLNGMSEEDLQQMALNLRQKFRFDRLKKLEHIKQYKIARNMHQEIVESMVDFYDQGKFEQKIDSSFFTEFADDYRIGKKQMDIISCEYDLTTDLGTRVFFDMIIYKSVPNANCITEVFIEKNRYRKPEKIEFLHSMLDSTVGLFEIVRVEEDMAYVTLKNIFTDEEIKITEIGLSGSPGANRNYIYTRIITYGETSFGTGLNMIFSKDDVFIRKFIEEEKKDYRPHGEIVRITKLYKQQSSVDGGFKIRNSNPFERK